MARADVTSNVTDVSGVERTLRRLLRTRDPHATELLQIALHADAPPLRIGAARALTRRRELAAHAALVDAWPDMDAATRAAIAESDARTKLRDNLPTLLADPSGRRRRSAADIALACDATEATASVVRAACETENPDGLELAKTALHLVESVRREFVCGVDGSDSLGRDPTFTRRAAVNALSEAAGAYADHRCEELIRAFLMLAPAEEASLQALLYDEAHPAHDEAMRVLRDDASAGVCELLGSILNDTAAPQAVLGLVASRCDGESVDAILRGVGLPVGARAKQNAERVEAFAWAEPERREVLLRIGDESQAVAVALAAASPLAPRKLAALVEMMLRGGGERARLEACRAIGQLPEHLAQSVVELALDDESPSVVAMATKFARQRGLPSRAGTLVDLLDHEDSEVRIAARESLPELSFPRYREAYQRLSADEQRSVGELVAKADPRAAATLLEELSAGAVSRRLGALEMVERMGLAIDLAEALIDRLRDADAGVRSEAARMLGDVAVSQPLVDALRDRLKDPSSSVVSAARASLATHGVSVEGGRR